MEKIWTAFVIFIFTIQSSNQQTRCFKCIVNNDPDQNVEPRALCGPFQRKSQKYVLNCPNATMCLTKIVFLDMGNGANSTAIERRCASQLEKDYQERVGNKYMMVTKIREAYDEGCNIEENYGIKSTKTWMCFCRGDLCNGQFVKIVQISNKSYDLALNSSASSLNYVDVHSLCFVGAYLLCLIGNY